MGFELVGTILRRPKNLITFISSVTRTKSARWGMYGPPVADLAAEDDSAVFGEVFQSIHVDPGPPRGEMMGRDGELLASMVDVPRLKDAAVVFERNIPVVGEEGDEGLNGGEEQAAHGQPSRRCLRGSVNKRRVRSRACIFSHTSSQCRIQSKHRHALAFWSSCQDE